MSKFLTKLKCEINNTLRYDYDGDVIGSVDKPIKLIDSLSENARRLLEIGIVQDRLVELGLNIRTFGTLAIGERILVVFTNHAAILLDHSFEYTSTTWQDDLINKVKELIKCNN